MSDPQCNVCHLFTCECGDAALEEIARLRQQLATLTQQRDMAVEALTIISLIEDAYDGGDWDEIEKARIIANKAIAAIQSSEVTG